LVDLTEPGYSAQVAGMVGSDVTMQSV
ncbi:hypothetical protein A2U01_0017211, partial [Trifolium medium]|nr:hypothetical protein [Trifolium medium]